MASPDKAAIMYDGDMSPLRFHSVVTEAHTATAEVTKFPVQTGAEVSNHVIRKNRTVTIEGMVSNHIIKGQGEAHQFTSNNPKTVFAELKRLVNGGVVCEVVTNLGKYTPVIWTKFSTKTKKENPDTLVFTISGEEVILATSINKASPAKITMSAVSEASRGAFEVAVKSAGLEFDPNAALEEGLFELDKGFAIDIKNAVGDISKLTYEAVGTDPTTGIHGFSLHTSDLELVLGEVTNELDIFSIVKDVIDGPVGNCVVQGGKELVEDVATDLINTGVGKLQNSIYGAYYETFGVNENESMGQIISSLGADCLMVGIADVDITTVLGIPTAADVLEGAVRKGGESVRKSLTARLVRVVQ
jgi:hypothetical protein